MKKRIIFTLVIGMILIIGSNTFSFAKEGRDLNKEREEIRGNIKERVATRADNLKNFKGLKLVISNGTITAINGTTLTVEKDGKTYSVLTVDKTQLRRKFWGESTISEMSVGDKVNVRGTWEDDGQTQVKALLIRDLSIKMRHGVFFGTVKSTNESGLVIDSAKRGTLSVTISGSTKYMNRKEENILLSDIKTGHRIRARGLWNSQKSTLTEVEAIKDFSLPEKFEKEATPSASSVN